MAIYQDEAKKMAVEIVKALAQAGTLKVSSLGGMVSDDPGAKSGKYIADMVNAIADGIVDKP